MLDEEVLEHYFHDFSQNIHTWLPEGLIEVDLDLLHKHNLLDFKDIPQSPNGLTRFFHLVETEEKLTLFNDEYIIWIVPDIEEDYTSTYTLIALNQDDTPHLEIGFKTTGVYNSSHLVLSLLDIFLAEIQENEDTLNSFTE